jgi:hypothetical protein
MRPITKIKELLNSPSFKGVNSPYAKGFKIQTKELIYILELTVTKQAYLEILERQIKQLETIIEASESNIVLTKFYTGRMMALFEVKKICKFEEW